MDHLDSKAIESFMIPEDEIATEGLLGGIVLSIVLLPYVKSVAITKPPFIYLYRRIVRLALLIILHIDHIVHYQ